MSAPFATSSKSISWLGPSSVVPADQWVPRTYHVGSWGRWSDRRKIRALREIAETYGRDPAFRNWVITQVIPSTEARDYEAQARALLRWVQDNIRYVNEPGELLQSPAYTLRVRHGDCDDMALLLGAMAHSIALPWSFVLAGKRGTKTIRWTERDGATPWNTRFYHIYCEIGWPIGRPSTWASAEPTLKNAPLGYDVVIHGYKSGPNGKPILPELAGPDGFGAIETNLPAPLVPVVETTKKLFGLVPWQDITLGVVQGVVTALLLRWLLKEKKR